jgi:hypothetical protein
LTIMAAVLPSAIAADTEEVLAVVVAPRSGHRVEGRDILAAIYRRKKQYWNDGQRIEPVNLPVDDPRRQRFSQLVLGLMPEQLDTYWNEMYFHGVLPPHVLASVEAVLRFVSTTPAAIGYVPLCSADMRVSLNIAIDSQGRIIDKPSQDGCTH